MARNQFPEKKKTTVQQAPSVSNPAKKTDFTAERPARSAVAPSAFADSVKAGGFIFGKLNYQVMLAGLAVIALGFFLMSGTTDIMSATKIVLAPLVVLAGFALEFVAIFITPRNTAGKA